MTELRSFIFIDQLQPQTLAYLASWMRGPLPRARMAAQVIAISPGLDIETLRCPIRINNQIYKFLLLRKQLSELDHPIYGDSKYTFNKSFKRLNKQLMLHSYEIKFMINNKKYTYRALLPDYFKKLLITKKLKFSNY